MTAMDNTAIGLSDMMHSDAKGLEGQSAVNVDDMELVRMGKKPKDEARVNVWTLCAYQVMMCSTWACVVVLYGTVFDIGGPVGLLYGSQHRGRSGPDGPHGVAGRVLRHLADGGWAAVLRAGPRKPPVASAAVVPRRLGARGSRDECQRLVCSAECEHHWLVCADGAPRLSLDVVGDLLLYLGFTTLALAMNTAPRMLPTYSSVGAFLTIGGFFAWAVTVLVKAPKSDARVVFATFLNNTSYSSSGWVFIMAFYNSIYGLYGTDAMMHLVEEMRNAAEDAPRAMVWSMVFASITTIVTDIILLFTCGDYASYAEELAPYVSWFANVSGSLYGGRLFISILFCIGNLLICVGVMASCSRLGWRMAEEKAFPCSAWLAVIHPSFGIPWNMMLVMFVAEILVGLVALGSDLAFYAIVSGSGVRGRQILPGRAHFDLGRWGLPLNYIAVAWALLVVAMYLSPLHVPVTGPGNIGNMNWTCVIVGAEVIFSLDYWFYSGRHHYMKEKETVLSVIDGEILALIDTMAEKQ